jgi:hypothetical protein
MGMKRNFAIDLSLILRLKSLRSTSARLGPLKNRDTCIYGKCIKRKSMKSLSHSALA